MVKRFQIRARIRSKEVTIHQDEVIGTRRGSRATGKDIRIGPKISDKILTRALKICNAPEARHASIIFIDLAYHPRAVDGRTLRLRLQVSTERGNYRRLRQGEMGYLNLCNQRDDYHTMVDRGGVHALHSNQRIQQKSTHVYYYAKHLKLILVGGVY
jgi:hypothetical protein